MNLQWSTANEKLKKTRAAWRRRFGDVGKFVGFSLPQLRSATGRTTCPFAGTCAEVCYASQGSYFMPHVQAKYAGCRYNLHVDVRGSSILFPFEDLQPWQMVQSCALDLAEHGGMTLDQVGRALAITRERVRQIEQRAIDRILERFDETTLRAVLRIRVSGPSYWDEG